MKDHWILQTTNKCQSEELPAEKIKPLDLTPSRFAARVLLPDKRDDRRRSDSGGSSGRIAAAVDVRGLN
jgi:hypothetical protein